MKNAKLFIVAGCIAIACATITAATIKAYGPVRESDYYSEPQEVRCRCYLDSGTTASGKQTRSGVIAGRKEWIGKVAALYQKNPDGTLGDFIGYYEFLDTGAGIDTDGDGIGDTIKTGNSVDVWVSSKDEASDWISKNGDYVYMQIINGEG
jgi:3D (Asp-Asp-Asp) domain-containing protein